MELKHNVKYFFIQNDGSDILITQELTQKDLAKLLLSQNVILDSVGISAAKPYRRRKKERGEINGNNKNCNSSS